MDKLIVIGIVLIFCILMVIYTQRDTASPKDKNLKEIVQDAYPEYKVIEKSTSIAICKPNARGVLDDLMIIRIDPEQKKNLRHSGTTLIATYSKRPSIREISKDFDAFFKR